MIQYNRKNKKLLPLARANRNNPTDAERKLWYLIKDETLGFKFRRQHRIGSYIVDFICLEKNLIIECDGGQHAENKSDEERTSFLNSKGYKVIRFWNTDILKNKEGIFTEILKALKN